MSQLGWVSIAIAMISLVVSAVTLWLTHLRTGKAFMTRPTQIYLGPDGGIGRFPKVFLQALLYSNAQKGCVIEDLFVAIKSGESTQTFPIWVRGQKANLKRSGGLFVGKDGVDEGHHFLLPKKSTHFRFEKGNYQFRVLAKTVGKQAAVELFNTILTVDEQQAKSMAAGNGLYFDWGPESQHYIAHIDDKDFESETKFFLEQAGKLIPFETD